MGLDPVVLGIICCVFSALGYTAVNICLRFLSVNCDQVWVICLKELVTVATVGPWLAWRACSGKVVLPPARTLAVLMLLGLVTQIGANLPVIWAMSVVGLAITIPVCMGVNLMASAVIAWVVLGERGSKTSAMAIGCLIGSIGLLGMGSSQANASMAALAGAAAGPFWVVLGVAAACLGGCIYASLAVVIRPSVTGSASPAAVVFVITGMGVVSLGPLSIWRHGAAGLLSTPPRDLCVMLAAGALNMLAFLAITKALQLTTVVHANALSASQVAMAVVAGMFLFAEPPNPWLIIGVSLTILGIMLIDRPADKSRHGDAQSQPQDETTAPSEFTTLPGA